MAKPTNQTQTTQPAAKRPIQKTTQELSQGGKPSIASLYPAWQTGKAYTPLEIVKYGTGPDGEPQLYAVMQAHTSQADWMPGPAMAALYKAIGFTPGGIAIWVQPQGGHDAYAIGAIVMHNGQKWKSTTASNVWEPGVYGWVIEP